MWYIFDHLSVIACHDGTYVASRGSDGVPALVPWQRGSNGKGFVEGSPVGEKLPSQSGPMSDGQAASFVKRSWILYRETAP